MFSGCPAVVNKAKTNCRSCKWHFKVKLLWIKREHWHLMSLSVVCVCFNFQQRSYSLILNDRLFFRPSKTFWGNLSVPIQDKYFHFFDENSCNQWAYIPWLFCPSVHSRCTLSCYSKSMFCFRLWDTKKNELALERVMSFNFLFLFI